MSSIVSFDFVDDLYPHLLGIFIPSFVMQLLINFPCSYFRLMDNFTGLIEFIPGVIWSLYYTRYKQNQSLQLRQILVTLSVIVWSIRLGKFLIDRMIYSSRLDTRVQELRKKYGNLGLFALWFGPHGFWSVICCLPIALIHAFPISNVNLNIFDLFGFSFWICGFLMETFADRKKFKAKLAKKKERYYNLGSMWNYSRNPNHCGEVFSWLGLSIVSLNIVFFHPKYRFNIWIFILSQINYLFTLFIMLFEATLSSEINNNKRYSNQLEYHQYRKRTSLLWPISPQIYLRLPKSIRESIFFEWNMYNEGLK